MKRFRLEEIGRALYGATWQTETARALGVGDRAVRHWYNADRPVPAWVWEELAGLCEERAKVLGYYATKLPSQAQAALDEETKLSSTKLPSKGKRENQLAPEAETNLPSSE